MSTESKIPETEDEVIIAPCRGCGVGIPTHPRNVMRAYDEDGNSEIVMSFDRCAECEAELKRRAAERKVREARAKAKYEKSLADLINSIPQKTERQIGFDMGIDSDSIPSVANQTKPAQCASLPDVDHQLRTLRPRLPAMHRRLSTPLLS